MLASSLAILSTMFSVVECVLNVVEESVLPSMLFVQSSDLQSINVSEHHLF